MDAHLEQKITVNEGARSRFVSITRQTRQRARIPYMTAIASTAMQPPTIFLDPINDIETDCRFVRLKQAFHKYSTTAITQCFQAWKPGKSLDNIEIVVGIILAGELKERMADGSR